MSQKPRWTPSIDADLMALFSVKSVPELACYFSRSEHAIKMRVWQLGLTNPVIDDPATDYGALIIANTAFIERMTDAVRKGLEHPPMIGIDKRHVGREPRFMKTGTAPVVRSTVWADM
jgi:hypothetical protein